MWNLKSMRLNGDDAYLVSEKVDKKTAKAVLVMITKSMKENGTRILAQNEMSLILSYGGDFGTIYSIEKAK